MSELKARLQSDVKEAMKAKEKQKLATIRLVMAAIKQKEVDERIELTDTDVLAILEKLVKQRKESISQYQTANRQDLVDQEQTELAIIQTYLPEPMAPDALMAIIDDCIQLTGATSMKDMGKVMAQVKEKVQGRADMSEVSKSIKSKLNG